MKLAASVAVAALATAVLLAKQPVASPWWTYADADASYTAVSIDLMAGEHTIFLDHPGLPLQDLMAMTTESRYLLHKARGSHDTPHQYAAQRLLHLDDSRVFFRGWAILFYAAGAAFAFVAFWRLLGDPLWGCLGPLLWLGAPGLQAMSIQFRPDGLLAGLVLAIGFLLVRAAERRSAWTYTLAALLLGLTLTVKIHAAALALPFAIALLWRPPARGWEAGFRADARAWLRRYRVPLALFAVVWVAFCVLFDPHRIAAGASRHQEKAFAAMAVAFVVFVALALLARRRFPAVLATALAAGLVLPGTLVLNDLPEMLVKIVSGLTGSGANSGVAPFSTPWRALFHTPVLQTTVLVALAGAAAALGARRRNLQPLLWFSGSVLAYVMATARLGTVHYYAPAYVLALPAVLWLARELPGPAAAAAAVAIAVFMLWYPVQNLSRPQRAAHFQQVQWSAIEPAGDRLLTRRGEIAVVDDYEKPVPDIRWYQLVRQYLPWAPPYPYRYLPDSGAAKQEAATLHLVPRYFLGNLPPTLSGPTREQLAFGSYVLRPLPDPALARVGLGFAALR